jgi:hypothetical protein
MAYSRLPTTPIKFSHSTSSVISRLKKNYQHQFEHGLLYNENGARYVIQQELVKKANHDVMEDNDVSSCQHVLMTDSDVSNDHVHSNQSEERFSSKMTEIDKLLLMHKNNYFMREGTEHFETARDLLVNVVNTAVKHKRSYAQLVELLGDRVMADVVPRLRGDSEAILAVKREFFLDLKMIGNCIKQFKHDFNQGVVFDEKMQLMPGIAQYEMFVVDSLKVQREHGDDLSSYLTLMRDRLPFGLSQKFEKELVKNSLGLSLRKMSN